MKKVMGLMVAGLALAGSVAMAAEEVTLPVARVMNVVSARVTDFDIDGRSNLPVKPYGGSISVNYTRQTATLFLETCPPNAMCITGGPSIELPIVHVLVDRCEVKTITAEENLLMVDGDAKTLTIIDYSQANPHCGIRVKAPTVVTLKTISSAMAGPSVETLSTFEAERLEQMMFMNR